MSDTSEMVEDLTKVPEMVRRVAEAITANNAGEWHLWLDEARAAIEAMREPTDDARIAWQSIRFPSSAGDYNEPLEEHVASQVWNAGIDAALAVPEEGGEAVSDPRDARIAELEAEVAGWKRVAVEAVIPLEAMRMAGADQLHSKALQDSVAHAVAIVRRAVAGDGLPPPIP